MVISRAIKFAFVISDFMTWILPGDVSSSKGQDLKSGAEDEVKKSGDSKLSESLGDDERRFALLQTSGAQ